MNPLSGHLRPITLFSSLFLFSYCDAKCFSSFFFFILRVQYETSMSHETHTFTWSTKTVIILRHLKRMVMSAVLKERLNLNFPQNIAKKQTNTFSVSSRFNW